MRRPLRTLAPAAILVILLGLTVPLSAGQLLKHSGTIVSISDDARTFVLAEIGPWKGKTRMTYRTITLAPGTRYAFVTRSDQPPSGFAGAYVEIPVGPDRIYLNDYVTVDCRHEGKRLVALKITAIEPERDSPGKGSSSR